jgi:hypothetical protein
MRLKKHAKKAATLCLQSDVGWPAAVESVAKILDDIDQEHKEIDPTCVAQMSLSQMQQEARALCDTSVVENPAWVSHAEHILALVASVEAAAQTDPQLQATAHFVAAKPPATPQAPQSTAHFHPQYGHAPPAQFIPQHPAGNPSAFMPPVYSQPTKKARRG